MTLIKIKLKFDKCQYIYWLRRYDAGPEWKLWLRLVTTFTSDLKLNNVNMDSVPDIYLMCLGF